jgi:hypothetical protein
MLAKNCLDLMRTKLLFGRIASSFLCKVLPFGGGSFICVCENSMNYMGKEKETCCGVWEYRIFNFRGQGSVDVLE